MIVEADTDCFQMPSFMIASATSMEQLKKKNDIPDLSKSFDKLNNVGREEAVKRIQELTRLSRYSYNLHDEVEWAADVLEDAQNAAGSAADDAATDDPKE